MPVREIKTTLSLDGEKQFKQELADARKEMRVMNADLKAMAAEFDSTGDEQKFFSQRVDLLNDKVKQQDELVKALNKAVDESAEKYGEAASKTQDYRIQLSNATAQLFKMRREAEEAQRDLDDLGRGTRKAGREIKEGIGESAEEAAGKLESMFDKMAGTVNDMRSSVAWSTTMSVGEFVFDAIESVMGFVQENQEYNRKLAQARSVIESYGYVNDEILQITEYAASITGEFETALEAIVNLAGAGFENKEQMEAAAKALLGGWISAGGTMDFSGLAEDLLETVKTKTPSGLYAELITKFTGRTVEDVQKVLESMTSQADVLEAAIAVLTEAGLQTKVEKYAADNAELVEAELKNVQLTSAWAALALELTPIVTGIQDTTITIVNVMTMIVDTIKNFYDKNRNILDSEWFEYIRDVAGTVLIPGYGGIQLWEKLGEWLLPSAGAENMPDFSQHKTNGMYTTIGDTSAIGAAIKTDIAMMRSESVMEEANAAGYDLMVSFGNGIAEGAAIPLKNVRDMIDQINAELNAIATPAYGLGWGGISGGNIALYMDGQKVGRLAADGVSSELGRKVDAKMMMN